MYEICDSINASILEGLESKRNSNILFKNIEFTDISIKIIKNVSNEKEIFIFKNYINKLYEILLDEINSSKNNYTFNNALNEEEFKKLLNESREKSKNEKKELIKLYCEKKKESKIMNSKVIINISNNKNNSNFNSLEEQRIINEDENENICNEISKIIDLKKIIEIYKNQKNQNIKGILITKKINNNDNYHDKFIVKMIN